MKILLTGVTGQLGGELLALLSSRAQVACIGRNRPAFDVSGWRECDLSDAAALASVLNDYKPELIINAAAYTAVDLAESEPALAYELNSNLPERLARWCCDNNARLIHYSTDYVFDGDAGQAYLESDKTNPQNIYGKSKLAGEQAIIQSGCQHIIIRTAWIYSSRGKNFVLSMLNLAQKGLDLKIVNDQVGSPTSAINLAVATDQIVQRWWTQAAGQCSGVYHYRDDGVMSWYEFAADIFRLAVKAGLLAKAPSLAAIPGSQFPQPAKRPAYSVLDCSKIGRDFEIQPAAFQGALQMVMAELVAIGIVANGQTGT